MELRDLRALLAVVESGSFTTAARELGYTQSAVSQQVAALEREVGHKLVERRPVRPTAAGRRLAEHASRVVRRLDVARSELRHLDLAPAALHLALAPLCPADTVARALAGLRSAHPLLRIVARSMPPEQALRELGAASVDAAVVDGVAGDNEPLHLAEAGLVTATPLAVSHLVVILVADHPLAGRSSVSLEVLTDAPYIEAPGLLGAWPALKRAPGRAAVSYQGQDLRIYVRLIAAGLGYGLLPASVTAELTGVRCVPLADRGLVHRSELVMLRGASEAGSVLDVLRALLVPAPAAAR